MKSAVLVSFLLIVTLAMIAYPVAAAPAHPRWGSFVNSSGVPPGSALVLNIVYTVTNDEDSGMLGYWALDNYNKRVQVWQDPTNPHLFYVVARYTGNWNTFAGALSPETGATQSQDASGTFQGGYVGTFTATGMVSSPAYHTFGNIGTFDFGGTKADVLLGTYGAGQTGPTAGFDWTSTYFAGVSGFTQSQWGWTYHYRGQTWNNYYSGNTGDIVV